MHDAEVRNRLPDLPLASAPEESECGFYLALRPGGFVLHMSASAAHLSQMRQQVSGEVRRAGASEETADAAALVASELVGNAVRLCGQYAPLVVQVAGLPDEVWVYVHDPEPGQVPHRSQALPDNDAFESGRGLWIVDLLAPGWTVEPTPLGKRIRCRVSTAGRNCA